MSDTLIFWLAIGTLVVVYCAVEVLLGRGFDFGFKPIERVCGRLPRRVQITLVAFLLAVAASAWIYGCSRPGFK
jgi:hypothetical protein